MLKIATEAPDFSIGLQTGEQFRLSHLQGKHHVVLFFYPKDFTAGCTRQACLFSDHHPDMTRFDAFLLGISGDSEERHRSFIAAHSLPFPLGSDPHHAVARLYRTVRFGLRQLRITYVIDKRGIIRGAAHHEFFIDRHWDFVASTLERLQEEE